MSAIASAAAVVQTVSIFATCGIPTNTLFPSGFVYGSASSSPAASACALVTASSLPTTATQSSGDSAFPLCPDGTIDPCSSTYEGLTCRTADDLAYTFSCAAVPVCGVALPGSAVAKRATEASFADCLTSCDDTTGCVAVLYEDLECTLYSSLTEVATTLQEVGLAVRYFANAGVTTISGTASSAIATSTVAGASTASGIASSAASTISSASASKATSASTSVSKATSASASAGKATTAPASASKATTASASVGDATTVLLPGVTVVSGVVLPPTAVTTYATTPTAVAMNWTTYKGNGCNLGVWLEKEKTHDPIWWDTYNSTALDEWTWCKDLGAECGPLLEARYTSFLNTSTIDALASVGVNTLRIPTTYAAWIVYPGTYLYTGSQQVHLREITDYAIHTYGMHIIIGLHSLPGGVNNLDIGEAFEHDKWFFNATNLAYSYKAVEAVLAFITTSGTPTYFTIAPINEASNDLAAFGSAAGLTANASDYVVNYIDGVINRTVAVDPRIPVMLQDCFKGAAFWEPLFPATTNMVIDVHVYYFADAGVYSEYVDPAVCGQAEYIAESASAAGTFPVFIGEWSLEVTYNNTYSARTSIFDTQRYAWSEYVSGGSFWTAVSYSITNVSGQGTEAEYWSYVLLIEEGVITNATNATYC